MGHPAASKQRIRSGDGGYSGRLCDGECPLVCLDETSKQPLADTRLPIAMKPGQLARRDYEYQRNGTAKFMIFAPLEAWRRVKVTDWRTAIDYAQALEDLSDRHFPNAKKIVLVQDNLNTHKPASLYEAFPAYKARRLVERFEWHYTPKHGSWLDMAESELAVLASQCLDRRIPDKHILIHQVAAWEADRNAHQAKADWQFTTDDARIKLKHLYPTFKMTRATSSVDFLSSRTRTTVPSRKRRMIGSSFKECAFQASQSPFTLRQTRLTVSFPTAPLNKAASVRRIQRVLVPER
jgi:DDE superfamily endonuclease